MFAYVIVNFDTRSLRVVHSQELAYQSSRLPNTVVVGIPQTPGRIQLVKAEDPPQVVIDDRDF